MRGTLLALPLAVLAAAASLSAHHAFGADYFETQKVSIEGDIIGVAFVNPHAWLYLAVKEENGEVQKYSVEWSNPARLKQAGFTAESFKPGDHLVITGSPGQDPAARRVHLRTIERPSDGWKWPKSGRDDEP